MYKMVSEVMVVNTYMRTLQLGWERGSSVTKRTATVQAQLYTTFSVDSSYQSLLRQFDTLILVKIRVNFGVGNCLHFCML